MPYYDDSYDDNIVYDDNVDNNAYDDQQYAYDDQGDPASYNDPGLFGYLYDPNSVDGYEPGAEAPADSDSIDVLPDGSLTFSPSGEQADPEAYNITAPRPVDALRMQSMQPDQSEQPDVQAPDIPELPGTDMGYERADFVEPQRTMYQLADLSQEFGRQPPVQDENVLNTVRPDLIPEATQSLPDDTVAPDAVPQDFQDAFTQRLANYTPEDLIPPDAVTPETGAPPAEAATGLPIDLSPDPRGAMLRVAYTDTPNYTPEDGELAVPSDAYHPGNPMPEGILFDAWNTLQETILPALGDIAATLGESTQVTTPFVREIMNIQTGLGTVAELGVKGRIAAGAGVTGPVAPAIWGGLAVQTLLTAPISQVVAEDIQNGNPSQAVQDVLAMGGKIQEQIGQALQMEDQHWENLNHYIVDPTRAALEQGDSVGALQNFRKGIRDMSVLEEEEYARRKSEGGDPGWFTDFVSDIAGTPQLGILNKVPGVNKLIDIPFAAGSKLAGKIPQTARGYGLLAGSEVGRGALWAMSNSADDAVREGYARQTPEAIKTWWTNVEPKLLELVEQRGRKTPRDVDISAFSPQEQSWLNLFKRADFDGVHDVIRGAVTRRREGSIVAFAEDLERSVQDKVTNNRRVMNQQAWEARDPLMRGLYQMSQPFVKGYENVMTGVGTAMSVMYLVTASYLAGNPAESLVRTMLGGAKPGMMSTNRWRDMASIFAKDAPLDLGDLAEARNPFNSQRKAFLDVFPGMAWLEHGVLDTANKWEVKIRRQAWADWASQAFEDRLRRAPQEFIGYMSNAKGELDGLGKMLPEANRDNMLRTSWFAAAAGTPGLEAMKQKVLNGDMARQEMEELLEKFPGLPQIQDHGLRWVHDGGAGAKYSTEFMNDARAAYPDHPPQLQGIFHEMDELFRKTKAEQVAGRSDWWEGEIVAPIAKEVDELVAKYSTAHKGADQDLADMLWKLTQVQLGDAQIAHYRQVEQIMNNPYYRGSAPGRSGGAVRQKIAEDAAAAANDYLALATARNQALAAKLGPAMEANGMGTADDVLSSFRKYSDGMKTYYEELAAATQSAWDDARAHKIPYGRLMNQIAANKGDVVDRSGGFLDEAQKFIAGVSGKRTPRGFSDRIQRVSEMVPDDYAGGGLDFDISPHSLFGRGGDFAEATAQAWDDLKALQEQMRTLWDTHPQNNPAFQAAASDAFDRLIARFSTLPDAVQKYGGVLIGQASDDAGRLYRMNFPVYDDLNVLTYMAQTIFPFFRYEAFRWPYLARTALHHPQLANAWFEYWNDSDQGYVKMPPFRTLGVVPLVGEGLSKGEWQWFPVGGTVFGGMRSAVRADFPPSGKTDKAAYDAVTDAPDLQPWEREWLKRPVLRDIVMFRRLGQAYDAAQETPGQYGSNPTIRGVVGTTALAKKVAERYGFFPNMLASLALGGAGGYLGEAAGPIIKGGLALAEQLPQHPKIYGTDIPIPVIGGIGDAAYSANSELLKDSFIENQVGHILADHGVTMKNATDEQKRAAWDLATSNQAFAEQVAGMRYRSVERQDYELNRLQALENMFSVDERGRQQREAILNYTGAKNLQDAETVLRAHGERLEDALGAVDKNLALNDQQRKILNAVPGAPERRAASEPFQTDDQKLVGEFNDMLRNRTELAKASINELSDDYKAGRITYTQFIKGAKEQRAARAEYGSALARDPKYASVQGMMNDANLKNQVSYQDDLEREWGGLIERNSSDAGRLDFDGLLRDRKAMLAARQQEAEQALAQGNEEPYRAYQAFRQNIAEKTDQWLPGLSHALEVQEKLDATVPRFKYVQPGDPLNDEIRDALSRYAEFAKVDGKNAKYTMRNAVQSGQVTPRQYELAYRFKGGYNPYYTKARQALYHSDPVYRNIYALPEDPVDYVQKVVDQANRPDPTAEELLDRYRIMNQ